MNVVPLRSVPHESTPVHFIGRLTAFMSDGRLGVEDEDGIVWSCRRAASCLLKPEAGDTVLLSGPDPHRVYLIAVIEQADASASRIDAPGDLTLGGGLGTVSIQSTGNVRLQSGATLEMASAKWALQASQGHCRVNEMHFTAQAADATVGRLRMVGRVFETVADRIVQMARNTLRLTDEIEQVRVGHLDCKATDTVRIHGQHTIVTGKELVKIDASQIHMG
ncbi:hypothetical protein J2W37_001650 [Variovorax paradoxus]|jgi:Protein of unknown function (DUF3540).|uniref:DUF3540 domain-containing protein n=1 Tax=Variovorax paradoxus TaxID=34073 RepID=A0AAE4BUU5_VARPD|nr:MULTISPECIES: DUF3540 domain-containing protein [Variovorax]MBD9668764.1 DUF3540 domain-containing protein [Variovorax sp. VRV01]MDP9963934.1 hypothetical protein [Variovorax paradoxus]MDR6425326.1 hypothetical protein [Variovorax paradoxus]MDR6453427.1 hypothetical protein [Variovorax paradoxus]